MKVVINKCYGGFNVSHEAILRYAEIKGVKLYPESIDSAFGGYIYYTQPPGQRVLPCSGADFYKLSMEERRAYNEAYEKQVMSVYNMRRDDPALIQAIEELGEKANGLCASLEIVNIPDGVSWQVEEYDGMERITEVHRTWG